MNKFILLIFFLSKFVYAGDLKTEQDAIDFCLTIHDEANTPKNADSSPARHIETIEIARVIAKASKPLSIINLESQEQKISQLNSVDCRG